MAWKALEKTMNKASQQKKDKVEVVPKKPDSITFGFQTVGASKNTFDSLNQI